MTYCVGLNLDDGLVFASDSRTNAGVDYVTTYSKMHVFNPSPDRLFVILSAGNLATTQEVVNHIQRDLDYPTGGPNLATVRYLFEAAEYIGSVSLAVQKEHSPALMQSGVSGETTLLIGGQIAGQRHGLMLVYPQGNYITSSPETPYLQIGESKYGKPALDRIVHPGLSLNQGARLALVSLDATTRSNITVGPPFELATYEKDSLVLGCRCRFDADDKYLISVREAWNQGIQEAFLNLPKFSWEVSAKEHPVAEPVPLQGS
ncbi:MAG: 20S proteasome subunit A/B [Chromatiaceae bacterium]|nr:20S proteasome subunit A/B [Gammaproteobacteria bacterium]MCP5305182.1 20S proteasome subunit A/B [Chromatiaceae bacterium]MCP5315141.1 20S proteasome subunit A/B [Chromatiaceae bacterium]